MRLACLPAIDSKAGDGLAVAEAWGYFSLSVTLSMAMAVALVWSFTRKEVMRGALSCRSRWSSSFDSSV